MKKILSIIAAISMIFTASLSCSATEEKTTGMIIYVSPSGNDSNDGSEGSPLATLQGARDKVRSVKTSGGLPTNGITVYFRGGEYHWKDTVEFNAEDSGEATSKIIYASYPGEEAVFTGGTRVPGNEFSAVTDEDILAKWRNKKVKESVRQINIKSFYEKLGYADINDYYPMKYDSYSQSRMTYKQMGDTQGEEDPDAYVRRAVVSIGDSPALWLARYPNKEGGKYEENPYPKFLTTGSVVKNSALTNKDTDGYVFTYSDRRISKYAGYSDVWLYSLPWNVFYHEDMKIAEINADNNTITSAVPSSQGIKENREFFIYNILDELDAPGEYYIDRNSGMMYIYPNAELENSYMNIAYFDKNYMIKTNKTSFVDFKGISFENTKGSGMLIKGGDSVLVDSCNFKNMGCTAVVMGDKSEATYTQFFDYKWTDWFPEGTSIEDAATIQYEHWMKPEFSTETRGKNHELYGCHIINTGRNAISLTGGNFYSDDSCNYSIDNCDISYPGINQRTYASCIGIGFIHGVKITNNKIGHFPGSGINGYITKGLIENNEIYDGLMESYDMGLIYLNYIVPAMDLKINHNYFHDTPSENEITSPASPTSQRSGIALDNMYGAQLDITNNVFKNIPRGMFINAEDKVNNNIYVDCYEPAYTRSMTTYYYPATAGNGTIWSPENGSLDNQNFSYMLIWPIFAKGEIGEKVKEQWNEKYPRIMDFVNTIQSQKHEGKQFYTLTNNLIVNKDVPLLGSHIKFNDIELYKENPISKTENNTYSNDTSCFVDYANGDYTLTDAGAKQYGIEAIDMKSIGLKTSFVGTELYKQTDSQIKQVSGEAPKADLSKVGNAVVLKIGASDALANGKAVKVDSNNAAVKPQIINSRTLVPARFIAESFGGEVGWDNDTRTVTIKINGKIVSMVLDKNELMIDGEVAATMDVPAQSIEGRTMVPLRSLCETALSKNVFWDNKGLIVISDQKGLLDSTADSALIDTIINSLK